MSRRLILLIACIAVAIGGVRACRDEHAAPAAPDHPLVAFVNSVAQEELGPRPAHAPLRAGSFDVELAKLGERLQAAWPTGADTPKERATARRKLLSGELSLDEAEPWLIEQVEASAALAPSILALATLEEGPSWRYSWMAGSRYTDEIVVARGAARSLRLRLRQEVDNRDWLEQHCVDVLALGRDFARSIHGRDAFRLTREALEPCAAALVPADDPAQRQALAAVRGGWIDRMQVVRFWHAELWADLLDSALPAEQVRRLPAGTTGILPSPTTEPKRLLEIGFERRALQDTVDALTAVLPEVLKALEEPSPAARDARLLALQSSSNTELGLTDRLLPGRAKAPRLPHTLYLHFDDRFARPSSLPLTVLETALAARAHHCATGGWPSPSQLDVPHIDPRTGEPLTLHLEQNTLHVQAADLRTGGAHPPADQQPIDIAVPPCDSATLAP